LASNYVGGMLLISLYKPKATIIQKLNIPSKFNSKWFRATQHVRNFKGLL